MSIATLTLGEAVTNAMTVVGHAPAEGVAWGFLALVSILWLAR